MLSVYHFRSAISSLGTQVLPFVQKAIQHFPECKKRMPQRHPLLSCTKRSPRRSAHLIAAECGGQKPRPAAWVLTPYAEAKCIALRAMHAAQAEPTHSRRLCRRSLTRSKSADFERRASEAKRHSLILITTPEPTVRPPSRIAKRRPSSIAMGVMSSTSISTLSPGMHISVPSGSAMTPVTSVVRK